MKQKLDKYERALEKDMDNWKKVSPTVRASMHKLVERARKDQPITLRMPKADLHKLKLVAQREGMPYQTLISSVLHKYVSGSLIDEELIKKASAILK